MTIRNLIKYATDPDHRAKVKKEREMNDAIAEAKRLHAATDFKYYVLPLFGKYRCLNMDAINILKKRGILPKRFDWMAAEKNSIFVTHNTKSHDPNTKENARQRSS